MTCARILSVSAASARFAADPLIDQFIEHTGLKRHGTGTVQAFETGFRSPAAPCTLLMSCSAFHSERFGRQGRQHRPQIFTPNCIFCLRNPKRERRKQRERFPTSNRLLLYFCNTVAVHGR